VILTGQSAVKSRRKAGLFPYHRCSWVELEMLKKSPTKWDKCYAQGVLQQGRLSRRKGKKERSLVEEQNQRNAVGSTPISRLSGAVSY
jgi:hypothetical protein